MLLSVAYCPPVEYFSLIAAACRRGEAVFIDGAGNYQKQSYRNRCRILAADGVQDLNFPIVHGESRRIDEIRVDYTTPWVKKTCKAISTAYDASPFFLYYKDGLFSIFESQPSTLWELDMSLLEFFCNKIGLPLPGTFTASEAAGQDYRELIHPKRPPVLKNREYWQVFRTGDGFVPNLSVMDLLFNEGPESLSFL